jgi:hypothetical protein
VLKGAVVIAQSRDAAQEQRPTPPSTRRAPKSGPEDARARSPSPPFGTSFGLGGIDVVLFEHLQRELARAATFRADGDALAASDVNRSTRTWPPWKTQLSSQ